MHRLEKTGSFAHRTSNCFLCLPTDPRQLSTSHLEMWLCLIVNSRAQHQRVWQAQAKQMCRCHQVALQTFSSEHAVPIAKEASQAAAQVNTYKTRGRCADRAGCSLALGMLPTPQVQSTEERATPADHTLRAHNSDEQHLSCITDLLWACCLSELSLPPAHGLCWHPCCQRSRSHLLVMHPAGAWLALQHSQQQRITDSRSRLGLSEDRTSQSILQSSSSEPHRPAAGNPQTALLSWTMQGGNKFQCTTRSSSWKGATKYSN